MTWLDYVKSLIDEENDRRRRSYEGQCIDYAEVARRDLDLGLPLRPFPAAQLSKALSTDEMGNPTDVETPNPVVKPYFRLEAHEDGFYRITTNIPVRRNGAGFQR